MKILIPADSILPTGGSFASAGKIQRIVVWTYRDEAAPNHARRKTFLRALLGCTRKLSNHRSEHAKFRWQYLLRRNGRRPAPVDLRCGHGNHCVRPVVVRKFCSSSAVV